MSTCSSLRYRQALWISLSIAFKQPANNFIVSVTNSDSLALLSQVINSSTSLSMIANEADEYVLKVKSSTNYSNSPYEFVVNAVAIMMAGRPSPITPYRLRTRFFPERLIRNLQDKEDKDVFYIDMESAGKFSLISKHLLDATNNYYRIRIIDSESAEIALRDVE